MRSTLRRNGGPKSTPVDNFSTGAAAPRWPCTTSRQRRAGPAPPLLQRRAPTCRAACRFTHVPRDDSQRSHVARPVGRLDQGRTFCLTRQPEMHCLSNRYPKLTESTSYNGNDDRNRHSIRIATQHGQPLNTDSHSIRAMQCGGMPPKPERSARGPGRAITPGAARVRGACRSMTIHQNAKGASARSHRHAIGSPHHANRATQTEQHASRCERKRNSMRRDANAPRLAKSRGAEVHRNGPSAVGGRIGHDRQPRQAQLAVGQAAP